MRSREQKIAREISANDIAIIGMSGKFPGADDLEKFWHNVRSGVETVSFFSDEDLLAAGVDPAEVANPHYVKAGAILNDITCFDAAFFGYSPKEAEIMDPQQRLFLECAWLALEHAGYNSETYHGSIGLYAGAGANTYALSILYKNHRLLEDVDEVQIALGNDNNFLATRVSYKLNLRGPSLVVQSACSTSLVAVHLACQGLLCGECHIALAGGVRIHIPQKQGYLYQEGGILSPDGHCRAFDAMAKGTVPGEGVGVVVLKRLVDAIDDGDTIHAVIKGSAINNDGSAKVGYTAPGVDSQAKVIREVLMLAEVDAESIQYVETHGTGTLLGDPIEIAALTKAFRISTQARNFCAIGSVKANIGHLDAAAGIASLLKATLALKHKEIPPELHFKQPNPQINFTDGPFYVNTTLTSWPRGATPRRAGVSSFGMGGTNAHLIVEEAPETPGSSTSKSDQLIVLSARSRSALEAETQHLIDYLVAHPQTSIADIAYTLQIGRRAFEHRRSFVCRDVQDALESMQAEAPRRLMDGYVSLQDRPVVFMFPGTGDQYLNMALQLYQHEPIFHEQLAHCALMLQPLLGLDIRDILYPDGTHAQAFEQSDRERSSMFSTGQIDLRKMVHHPLEAENGTEQRLHQTSLIQPIVFVVEYALAQMWMHYGIRPTAMIGYSTGEFVAACLAGVLSLDDALVLITKRAELVQSLPTGLALAVRLSESDVQPLLNQELSLSAINSDSFCVIAGSAPAIIFLEQQLTQREIIYRRLPTFHAFHSHMMEPAREPFVELVQRFTLNPPQIPYVSTITGKWISESEVLDPHYWGAHLRKPVRFAEGMDLLLEDTTTLFLEVGPGQMLCSLTRQRPTYDAARVVLPSMRSKYVRQSDLEVFLNTLGKLWLAGKNIEWSALYSGEYRQRIPLPSYPLERHYYWPQASKQTTVEHSHSDSISKEEFVPHLYIPTWKRSPFFSRPMFNLRQKQRWLVFVGGDRISTSVLEQLKRNGQDVTVVQRGEYFSEIAHNHYTLDSEKEQGYAPLWEHLEAHRWLPDHILHLWTIPRSVPPYDDLVQELGFYCLVSLVKEFATRHPGMEVQVWVISSGLHEVSGDEVLCPEKAPILGACLVIPQEYRSITCCNIDIIAPPVSSTQEAHVINQILFELNSKRPANAIVAYRGNYRWIPSFEPVHQEDGPEPLPTSRLRKGGVYLLTGGLGRIGLRLACYLKETLQAHVVLLGRSTFPPRNSWPSWLSIHGYENPISKKILQLQQMEEGGTEVMILQADVTDLSHMQNAVHRIYQELGALHGVFHLAGSIGEHTFRPISEITRADCELQFQAKVRGVVVLEQVLADRELDFCLLQSSTAAILGGLGFVAYAAANRFMDTFTLLHNREKTTPWISINWDGWHTDEESSVPTATRSDAHTYFMSVPEAIHALQQALTLGSQVVVATGNFFARQQRWLQLQSAEVPAPRRGDAEMMPYTRPELSTAYTAPRNHVEQRICSLWQQLLGIEQIGIYDLFLEMGADSLLSMQAIARLSKQFQLELPLRRLLEAQCTAEMAQIIEEIMLDKIENVSDEEAQKIIQQIRDATGADGKQ